MRKKEVIAWAIAVLYFFPCRTFSQAEADITYLEIPAPREGEVILQHTAYTLSYNPSFHVANWVAYELTREETIAAVKRNNRFVPDPLLPAGSASNEDYRGTGYDKGHLAPAADMAFSSQTMTESFYLSNMAPQEPAFNRGIWKRLEDRVRDWAEKEDTVYVVTGTVLTEGLSTIGRDRITVPALFYKVILDCTEPGIKGIGFLMPNEGSQLPLQHYAVTIDSVESLSGSDFFPKLPDDLEKQVENSIDLSLWNW